MKKAIATILVLVGLGFSNHTSYNKELLMKSYEAGYKRATNRCKQNVDVTMFPQIWQMDSVEFSEIVYEK